METPFVPSDDFAAATRLLTDTRLCLTEIAVRCGFESLKSMRRAFLDRCGSTPAQIRGRHIVEQREGARARVE